MIGLLIITTRKYKQFTQSLIGQIDQFFLPGHEKTIFVFTDELQELKSESNIEQIIIPAYKFPYATLYRFKIFSENEDVLKACSHLFYLDADMGIASIVGEEFLVSGLIAVRHPGFFRNNGWGDSNNPQKSTSYMPPQHRKHYYCGGVQGGASDAYLRMTKSLSKNIDEDERNGVIAQHNDETHYNRYINWTKPDDILVTEFTPSYCMPEEPYYKEQWGLGNLPSIILALSKNHEEIRK